MDDYEELKKIIDGASDIVFFGGAGVSTESGIPDFRGAGGLYLGEEDDGVPPEEKLHIRYFLRNPEGFYRYYRRHMLYPEARPNAAHLALAALERAGKLKGILYAAGLEIDTNERTVKRNGELITLKPMEFDLLVMLAKNKNIALTREKLLFGVWGANYVGETRTVDVHIAQIRKKLDLHDSIRTITKLGYRLED